MNQLLVNLIAGSSFLITLLLFLNPNKYNKAGNRWLSLFIFCIFLMNIDEFLYYNDLNIPTIKFYVFSRYCIVPVFYFTIIYFIKPTKKWKPLYFLHFTFGLLFIIFEQNSTQILNGNMVINKSVSSHFLIYFNAFLMYIVLPLQFVVYFWQCFKELKKHNLIINKYSSNVEEIDLKWLKHILYIIISFSFFFIIYIFVQNAIMINSLLLISLIFIGYNAMKQKEIFPYSKSSKQEIKTLIREEKKQKLNKKKEPSSNNQNIYNNLLQVMQRDKPFLNFELSLFSLANQLGVTAHSLSFVINEYSGENYNQFINRYRIEEAKKLILNPKMDHLNILGIGYEVGFNSKSTFNSTFKKFTSQTPSEYKKSNSTLKISLEL